MLPDLVPATPTVVLGDLSLIPWDHDSPAQLERLRLQRVACGWKQDYIDAWQSKQRQGYIGMYWIVSQDSPPTRQALYETKTMGSC
jgi:hypothetical protein